MSKHNEKWIARRGLLGAAIALIGTQAAWAEIVVDGTLNPARAGAVQGPNFAITADLGVQKGANLFHSFRTFDLYRGESATFSGPARVSNILARVTGADASWIDGRLASSIAGANLYFLNPKGMVFGPNAELDISGSFHASTGDYLRLADGGVFHASVPDNSILTVAEPAAFGFLTPSPRSIDIRGASLSAQRDEALSFVGGDISVRSASTVATESGKLTLVSVNSAGELPMTQAAPDVSGFERLGRLLIKDGALVYSETSGAQPGGAVHVRASRLELTASSLLASNTMGTSPGGNIDIAASDSVLIDKAGDLLSLSEGRGDAGSVHVRTPRLEVLEGGMVRSLSRGNGAAGSIAIDGGGLVRVAGGGFVKAEATDSGHAGSIMIDAGRLEVSEQGTIRRNSFGTTASPGPSGSIEINASDSVQIDGAMNSRMSTGVFAHTNGPDAAGSIRVRTPSLDVAGEGKIQSLTSGSGAGADIDLHSDGLVRVAAEGSVGVWAINTGHAGSITIDAERVELSDGGQVNATSLGKMAGAGDGGSIDITASKSVRIDGRASSIRTELAADSMGPGAAGSIRVRTPHLEVLGGGGITSVTLGTGPGGSIVIDVSGLVRVAGVAHGRASRVTVETIGSGNAGLITIDAARLELSDAGRIRGDTRGEMPNAGRGGSIDVKASEWVRIDGSSNSRATELSADSLGPGAAGSIRVHTPSLEVLGGGRIGSAAFDAGAGGSIVIDGGGVVRVAGVAHDQASKISAQTEGSGNAGSVTIDAVRLEVLGGGQIKAISFGTTPGASRGGSIEINATESVRIHGASSESEPTGLLADTEGAGDAGSIHVRTPSLELLGGGQISSVVGASGAGGTIAIESGRVRVAGQGVISTETEGSGNAGTIRLDAARLELLDEGQIRAGTAGAGRGGSIDIRTSEAVLIEGARDQNPLPTLSAGTTGPGAGGRISMSTPRLRIVGGTIGSSTFGSGLAGEVLVNSDDIMLEGDAIIRSRSLSAEEDAGTAGNINITAANTLVLEGRSSISTQSAWAGGGDITIKAGRMVKLEDSTISTSVGGGAGNGGNIFIDPRFVVLNRSGITANAVAGNGGNIGIVTDHLVQSADSVIDASSQLGIDGNVQISSPNTDVSSSLSRLPAGLVDAASRMRESCAARAARATTNSFVGVGAGGLSAGPYSAQVADYAALLEPPMEPGSTTRHIPSGSSSFGASLAWSCEAEVPSPRP